MIVLPTRRRLIRRRNALYEQLYSILSFASITEVEYIARQINIITQRINTYFIKENEPREIFEDD